MMMRKANFYWQRLIEKIPIHIWWKNKDLIYLGCNLKVLEALGFSSYDAFVGKTDYEIWDKKIADKLKEADIYVLTTGKEVNLEETIVRHDSKRLIMLTSKSPFLNEKGEVIGIIGTSVDITERKEVETNLAQAKRVAEAATMAKTEFLANMSHDIRTPLLGMVGLTEYLYEKIKDQDLKARAFQLVDLSKNLLEVSNSLIDGAQAELGELPIKNELFNLRKLLLAVKSLMLPAIQSKKLELQIKQDKTLPEFLIGDEKRIWRIVQNLVSNAVKFTRKGFIHVWIQVKPNREKASAKILEIKIQDSGIGIPEAKQKEIFERFSQLSTQSKGQGFGIGLSIVQQFIKDLNGTIEIESKMDEGSTFICCIPVKVSEGKDLDSFLIVKEERGEYHKNLDFSHLKVLLVEDNKIASFSVQQQLKAFHFRVKVVESAEQAIHLYKKNHYDLILTDINLPGQNGYWLTECIRSLEKNNPGYYSKHPAIIVGFSAHLGEPEREQCGLAGMDQCILKPLTQEKIIATLKEYFSFEGSKGSNPPNLGDAIVSSLISSSLKVIDLQASAKEFYSNDLKMAEKMLRLLVDGLNSEEARMKKSLDKGEWGNLYHLVHNFYGGCVSCGVPQLAKAVGFLKNALRKGNREEVPLLYQKVVTEMNKVNSLFKKLFGEGSE